MKNSIASVLEARHDGPCEYTFFGSFPDKSGKVGPQEVWRCDHCGHGITRPPLADVAFLYENRGSQDFQPLATGLARTIKKIAFARQARTLLRRLPDRPASVLDYGCGSGLFTKVLGDLVGPGAVTGCDFHPEPPAELADRPYCQMSSLTGEVRPVDLVLAMHVLEHDDDAAGLLARITAMAKPGGLVVLEVPNIDCIWAKPLGPAWDAWYLPFHRSHFSRASLCAIIEAHGLDLLAIEDVCLPSIGRSLANLCAAGNGLVFLLAGIALHPVQWAAEKLSGRPSALRVITRKRA